MRTDCAPGECRALMAGRGATTLALFSIAPILNEPEPYMSEVTIKARENGPFLVTGPVTLTDAQGNRFDLAGKESFALCRCGASQRKPFCDGSHKGCGFISNEAPPPPAPRE